MGDETARKAADRERERERERGQLELILARIANDSLLSLYSLSSLPPRPNKKRENISIKICML